MNNTRMRTLFLVLVLIALSFPVSAQSDMPYGKSELAIAARFNFKTVGSAGRKRQFKHKLSFTALNKMGSFIAMNIGGDISSA